MCNKINERVALVMLIVCSLYFYGYNYPRYVFLLLFSIGINYLLGNSIFKYRKENKKKNSLWTFVVGLLFNIGVIFYFKYYAFFLFSSNMLLKTEFIVPNILLPLGISFFTFQQISFLADAYTQKITEYSFLQYASYISFFPQLVAGPIVLQEEYLPQIQNKSKKTINYDNALQGILRFVYGLSKKVIVADSLAVPVNFGYANIEQLTSLDAIILVISFTFQLYFDFSAYSDMAIGIGRMFNIVLPNNFNSPLRSLSIPEFWKRWHMTLGRFLTTYVYIPLGGNRKGCFRTYLNIFAVFLVSGIWHGANYTFILWGILHGVFSILYRINQKWYDCLPKFFRWLCTFSIVVLLFALFRSDGVKDWIKLLEKIFMEKTFYFSEEFLIQYGFKELGFIYWIIFGEVLEKNKILTCLLLVIGCLGISLFGENLNTKKLKTNVANLLLAACVLVWCICSMGRVSSFLYFNF